MANRHLLLTLVVCFVLASFPMAAGGDEKIADKDTTSFTISRCCALYAVGAGVGGALSAFAIFPAILGILGFGAAGPAAGTAATAWQATMGGTVIGGGLFATLQAIAMAGVRRPAVVGTGVATAFGMTLFCGKLEELGLCDPVASFFKS